MTTITYSDNDRKVCPGCCTWRAYHLPLVENANHQDWGRNDLPTLLHSLDYLVGCYRRWHLSSGRAWRGWWFALTCLTGMSINILAVVPYIMPSWTIAMAWKVLFNNGTLGGVSGMLMYLTGVPPPDWLAFGPVPIIISSGSTLLHLLLSVRFSCVDVD